MQESGLAEAAASVLQLATTARPARRTGWARAKLGALAESSKAASTRAVTTEPRPPLPLQPLLRQERVAICGLQRVQGVRFLPTNGVRSRSLRRRRKRSARWSRTSAPRD